MPFQEIPHTADYALRVWAADISSLFVEAASGMWSLCGAHTINNPSIERDLELAASTLEGLLVAFLSELVYSAEKERVIFTDIESIHISEVDGNYALKTHLKGLPLVSQNKYIKAVTYHNLNIQKLEENFEVIIVFDV